MSASAGDGYIFLSYAKEDAAGARRVSARLRRDRISVWMDEHNLLPGEAWESLIQSKISHAAAFLVLLSARAVDKRGFVQKEIRLALAAAERMPEGSIFVLPARVDECPLPDHLARWHSVDLFKRGGYQRLLRSLRTHAKSVFQPGRGRPDVSFANAAEHQLFEILEQSRTFLHCRLGPKQYVFSQGHFLVVLESFPDCLRQLRDRDNRKLARAAAEAMIVKSRALRSDARKVHSLKVDTQEEIVELRSRAGAAYVALSYWRVVSQLAPDAVAFASGNDVPVYFEQDGHVAAIVMPYLADKDQIARFAAMVP